MTRNTGRSPLTTHGTPAPKPLAHTETNSEWLPDSVLLEVLYYLSVPDILRLRQVSRQCQRLTRERPVWVNAYKTSTVLRPPGPFPSHSAAHLEQQLKKSIELHENFTSSCPEPVHSRILNLGDYRRAYAMTLVLGRYLLTSGYLELHCYDLDLLKDEDERNGDEAEPIASYDMRAFPKDRFHTLVDTNENDREHVYGSPLSIALVIELGARLYGGPKDSLIRFLDLYVTPGTARFELKKEVHFPACGDMNFTGDYLFANPGEPVLLHIPTSRIYHLPLCSSYEPQLRRRNNVILTSTHLLVDSYHKNFELLEAFLLPDNTPESLQPSTDERLVLTRSHMVYHHNEIRGMVLLSSHTKHTQSRVKKDQNSCRDLLDTTIFMTLFVVVRMEREPLVVADHFISFLDVVMESPAAGKGSMTISCPPGLRVRGVYGVNASVQRGCARFITAMPSFVCTVNERNRSLVESACLPFDEALFLQADCLTGRVCELTEHSQKCIYVYDYV